MIKKVFDSRNVEYINEKNIKYFTQDSNGFNVTLVNGTLINIAKIDVAGFVQCGNMYFNREYVTDIEVGINRSTVTVFVDREHGRTFEGVGTDGVVDLAAGFIQIRKENGSSIHINPAFVNTVVKPFVTATVNITTDMGVETIAAGIASNQMVVVQIRLDSGREFKFSGNEAIQVVDHCESALPKIDDEKDAKKGKK